MGIGVKEMIQSDVLFDGHSLFICGCGRVHHSFVDPLFGRGRHSGRQDCGHA